MEIVLAESAGFCFGVKRALEMVHQALEDTRVPIHCLGPLIHNPEVVRELEQKGLRTVAAIDEVRTGRVIIRSHGVGPAVYQTAQARNLEITDATCPFVKNVQQLAVGLREQGYQVIIYGDAVHAEVKGVLDSVEGAAWVAREAAGLDAIPVHSQVGVLSQTTQDVAGFQEIVAGLIPRTKELRVYNTICLATSQRQQEAAALSRQVDLMLVVGGKNSANTARLVEICRNRGATTHPVESAAEIRPEWFRPDMKIGVTAGASTPEQHIIAVIARIKEIGGNQTVTEEHVEMEKETLDSEETVDYEWPEDRFRELMPGQIIEAKVILVRDDAAFVDIGGKSDLTIPVEELSVHPAASAKEIVKVGDVIRVMVTRSGDEDKILLSKKLVDQEQIWFDLEEAFREQKPVDGLISEAVKGGLSVNIGGLRAFMPASQAALGYVANLESLVGESGPVKIIEFERARKRIVVSRRVLLEVEKQKAEAELFAEIKENERRSGKVTRIADFGAFVDLGSGVEGLIHISELSWNRVKSAREILKEGDPVEVLVTKVDPAAKKISLSLKQIQSHPWEDAVKNFREEGIYPGSVVKLESFGAFVRLAPGLDGLVHVSQIAEKRISKPEEVLSVGQEVQVKILKIDTAGRRISLSMKEVAQDHEKQEMDSFLDAQEPDGMSQNLGELMKK